MTATKPVTWILQDLATRLGAEVVGAGDRTIESVASLDKASSGCLTFVGDEKQLRKLTNCQATAAIVSRKAVQPLSQWEGIGPTLLLVDNPLDAFVAVAQLLRPERARTPIGISPGAFVSPTAKIGAETNIHPGASVGDDVVIGARCEIHTGAVIGAGCVLGDDTTLFPHAVLYPDTHLGDRVRVHANAVLGADGFGYRLVNGRHQKIPHFGSVQVGNDVEIGAGTTIDRGMIDATVIGEGTKIDNHVMIAHNCKLGKHNILVAQVGFAGSVTTGDYVVCAGQVGVADHIHLGHRVVVGSKAGVHKDIPDGETYIGQPAMPAPEAMKIVMAQRKLPEMRAKLKDLESEVSTLRKELQQVVVKAGRESGEADVRPAA